MNKMLFAGLLALGLTLLTGDAVAQQGTKGKGKPNVELREQRERSKDMRKEAEERAEREREEGEERAEQERERAEEMREEAEERAEKERERAGDEEGFGHDLDDDRVRSEGRGNERSQAMRERRDERKQIQEEYRENRVDGQEGDAAREGDEDQKKAKKPWWKFWGD